MKIVYDADCKAVVMAIITEKCPSAMEMEDIFASCDSIQTRLAEILDYSSMQNNKISFMMS